jgi:hypothetical protein
MIFTCCHIRLIRCIYNYKTWKTERKLLDKKLAVKRVPASRDDVRGKDLKRSWSLGPEQDLVEMLHGSPMLLKA